MRLSFQDISRAIIRHYSKQIFGHQLHKGIVILLEDFLEVALDIVCDGKESAGSLVRMCFIYYL